MIRAKPAEHVYLRFSLSRDSKIEMSSMTDSQTSKINETLELDLQIISYLLFKHNHFRFTGLVLS